MRKILFRGKRLDNGEWVEGDLVNSVYKIGDTCVGTYGSFLGMHQVAPSTVGQYTGRQDKNGKRIFEGDIVEHAGKRFVIEYIEKYCRFAGTRPGIVFAGFAFEHCEVVGNIHDHPDLMERR